MVLPNGYGHGDGRPIKQVDAAAFPEPLGVGLASRFRPTWQATAEKQRSGSRFLAWQ